MTSEEPDPLSSIRTLQGKAFAAKSRVQVRPEHVALFKPLADGEDEFEEVEEEDDADEDSDDSPRSRKKQPAVEIATDDTLVGVRIAIFDPRARETFEPNLQWALMSDWSVGREARTADQRFQLRPYMLRRIPQVLSDHQGAASGQRVTTRAAVSRGHGRVRAKDRRLSCALPIGVRTLPLFALDQATALAALAAEIKAAWLQQSE